MISVFAQIKRELAAFFYSPIAYVVLVAAMLVNGIVFGMIVDLLSDPRAGHGAAMQIMFSNEFYWFLMLIICPLITMRLFSEERHSGTIETLLTAPIGTVGVTIAKYVAAVIFWIVIWLPTIAYPLLLSRYSSIEAGPVMSGYLGTLGVGMMLLSVGLFFSALTKNQIVSALLAFGANMGIFLLGLSSSMGGSSLSDSPMEYINLFDHMLNFSRGIVDTRHLTYYGTVSVFMLFATVQILEMRRWRG